MTTTPTALERAIFACSLTIGLIAAIAEPLCSATAAEQVIELSGDWQVRLDPETAYNPAEERAGDAPLFRPVRLPGSLRESGLGDPVGPLTKWIGLVRTESWNQPQYAPYREEGQFKVPFWLQPDRHYVGTAWYRRRVEIPPSWQDHRVILILERPHWQTGVWIDDQAVGKHDSLSTAHRFELTEHLTPGVHTLSIRVDNSLSSVDVGLNSHSVSDHTQSAWHGIVGKMELRAEPLVAIENIQVHPDQAGRALLVRLKSANATNQVDQNVITLRVTQEDQVLAENNFPVAIPVGGKSFDFTLPLRQQPKRWDEFHPVLCHLQATLESGAAETQVYRESFGVRDISTADGQLVLNGRPIFLRGTLECCIFPLTGYPPTDVDSWKRIINVCKAHGLNHIRFHSWCPPKAAFVAADELGFYYQVECSTWPNNSTRLGEGRPIDEWLYREANQILDAYGNHPSFLLLAAGNEPAGPQRGGQYLGPWVDYFNKQDDRMLVTSGAGWPSIDENEFHVTPAPRIQQWGQGLGSRINAQPPETETDYRDIVANYTAPVVSHEIGQWCVYPNFDEIQKYTGTLKPRNFEIFRDFLEHAQMLDQAHDFLMASGKLQAMCYKEEIESSLRTPAFGGFQLLDLHDFPGQGTALVGVLDPFWDSKPYIRPEQFRRFCGATVPLARISKRTWTWGEVFVAEIEASHFGPQTLRDAVPRWTVTDGQSQVASGVLPKREIAPGGLRKLGRMEVDLSSITKASKLKLTVTLHDRQNEIANDWDFWVYPSQVDITPPEDVMVVAELNVDAVRRLTEGGKVLLLADPRSVKSNVALGFSSIFWNTAWTSGQPPHTLGVLCDPEHPALNRFPTDYHSDWQWWELISRASAMDLDELPPAVRPVVQVVPDWFAPQRLGLVLEAKVGGGKLLVCSIDLESDLSERPAARQMLSSLLSYAASDAFDPPHQITADQVRGLFREIPMMQKLGATLKCDIQQPGYEAARAIDGDPSTIWHTAWTPGPAPQPHWLTIDLGERKTIAGIRCLPRSDMTNGRIQDFEVFVSNDAENWTAAASGRWTNDATMKTERFVQNHIVRYVKLVSLREVNGQEFASLAEIDVIVPDASQEIREPTTPHIDPPEASP